MGLRELERGWGKWREDQAAAQTKQDGGSGQKAPGQCGIAGRTGFGGGQGQGLVGQGDKGGVRGWGTVDRGGDGALS